MKTLKEQNDAGVTIAVCMGLCAAIIMACMIIKIMGGS